MKYASQPNIVSFIIRFVREPCQQPTDIHLYRGAIRHIQTDETFIFTQWEDAVNFIREYVPLENAEKQNAHEE